MSEEANTCEHLERTSAYVDGQLAVDAEAAAAAHIAECAACQRVVETVVGMAAVLPEPAAVATADAEPDDDDDDAADAAAPRKRWPFAVAGLVIAAAAAAIALYLGRTPPPISTTVAIELPPERAIEARFTGEHFAPHRPYAVARGAAPAENIELGALAELQHHNDLPDLVAGLAATGNLGQAQRVAASLPDTPAADSDRAAVALVAGDTDAALSYAYRTVEREPAQLAAWWNLGLAARNAGLPHVARDAFAKVVAGNEPGWADEARAFVAAFDRELAPFGPDLDAFRQRGEQMVAGGPVLAAADVPRYPAFARLYAIDAIRLASGPRLAALRPLARALDDLAGAADPDAVTAAIDRAAAADPKLRASFAAGYAAERAGSAPPADVDAMIASLTHAGSGVADLLAGALVLSPHPDPEQLAKLTAPWHDPWFDFAVARARVRSLDPLDPRAEAILGDASAACGPRLAYRCGQLELLLARYLSATGRQADAAERGTRAVASFASAAVPDDLLEARAVLGDIYRQQGRRALARAELDEVARAAAGRDCDAQRFALIGLADLALGAGAWDAVRAALPPATPPPGCTQAPNTLGLGTATDLARRTRDAHDVTIAKAWIAAEPASSPVALVAAARLAPAHDPQALAAMRAALATLAATTPDGAGVRTWGYTTAISDAGARAAWPEVIAAALEEHPSGSDAPCYLAVSYDDGDVTIAARTPAGIAGEQHHIEPTQLARAQLVPPALAQQLGACASIAVAARPPLHGRADLLPPALPWWFAGDVPARAPAGAAPSSLVVAQALAPSPFPALAPVASALTFDQTISGKTATPDAVLAALATATYAELHVHGVPATANAGAAFLALAPAADGGYALRAETVAAAHLAHAPVIVLAACNAAETAPWLRARWSLPDAFLHAGASAVIAADVEIPDRDAQAVFDELHRRLDAHDPIEQIVADLRVAHPGWAAHLMVFR